MVEKRYEEYPQIARLVRTMTPEGREVVAHWHRVLTTALEGFIPSAKKEVTEGLRGLVPVSERRAATGAAGSALISWLRVMRNVAGIIADPVEGDWCCQRGMLASPEPCPQHGYHHGQNYELGTVIEKVDDGSAVPGGRMKMERAICVQAFGADDENDKEWVSITHGYFLSKWELAESAWKVVGRA